MKHAVFLLILLDLASCKDNGTCPAPGPGAPCQGQCADGLTCVEGICRSTCDSAGDCAEELGCRDGFCRPCSEDRDCREGQTCENSGTCLFAKRGLGDACDDNLDCLSGFCADGVCCESACDGGCRTCAGQLPGRCLRDMKGDCVITYPEQAASIKDALARVADGGMITVTTDTDENILVDTDKSVTIEGAGDAPPIISAASGETAVHVEKAASFTMRNLRISGGKHGVFVSAPVPVTLTSLTIRHADIGINIDHGDQWRPDALAKIQDCDLFNNRQVGLAVRSAPVDMSGTRLHNNRRALRVEGTHSFAATDSILSQSYGRYPTAFIASNNIYLQRCIFWDNAGLASLLFFEVDQATLSQSAFSRNATAAIHILDSSSIELADIVVKNQVNTFVETFLFQKSSDEADLGDIDASSLIDLPAFEAMPESMPDFGESSWQGNGIEINNSQHILIDAPSLAANEGTGILIRNSTDISINNGSVIFNKKSGITAKDSFDVGIHRMTVGLNASFGLSIYGGLAIVDFSDLSTNTQNDEGKWGVGLYVEGGSHVVDNNYIIYNRLAGMLMLNRAEVWFDGNEIHDSDIAVGIDVGCLPHEGNNTVSCIEFDPCIDWMEIAPQPAPPPAYPMDPLSND